MNKMESKYFITITQDGRLKSVEVVGPGAAGGSVSTLYRYAGEKGKQILFSQIAHLPDDYGCVGPDEIAFDDIRDDDVLKIFNLDTLEKMLEAGVKRSDIVLKHVDEKELRPVSLKVTLNEKTVGTQLQSTAIPESPRSFMDKWGM